MTEYDEFENFYKTKNVNLRKNFLKYILSDFDESASENFNELLDWWFYGKYGEIPYTELYGDYLIFKDNNYIKTKIELFLNSLENTNSVLKSCENCNIPYTKLNIWLELGKNNEKPFDTLYKKFKLHLNSQLESKTNIFLESFNGYNENQACNDAEISEMQLSSWLRLNKIGGNFNRLYNQYQKILIENDYGNFNDFYKNYYFSKNSLDMLFLLSDVGKTKYPKIFEDYNLIFSNSNINKNKMKYPETHIDKFLEDSRYYSEIGSMRILNPDTINEEIQNIVNYDKHNQNHYHEKNIDKFLDFVAVGLDSIESAKLANCDYEYIKSWLTGESYKSEYNTIADDYNSALILNDYIDLISTKLDSFKFYFNEGKSIEEICDILIIPLKDIELYFNLGKLNYEPYTLFYNQIIKDKLYNENNLKTFLTEIERGNFKNNDMELIENFIEKGKEGLNPYELFYVDYKLSLIKNYHVNKNSKVKTFLEEIKNGNSDEDASQISEIPLDVIEFWLSLNCLQEFKNNYLNYKDPIFFLPENFNAREKFLNEIADGINKKIACENLSISENVIDEWLAKGKLEEEPYIEFFKKYLIAVDSIHDVQLRESFLNSLYEGYSKEKAAKQNNIPLNEINEWLELGKKYFEPYTDFYQDYLKTIEPDYFSAENIKIREIFIADITDGITKGNAIKRNNLPQLKINTWLKKGSKCNEPYDKFYEEYNTAKYEGFLNDENVKIRNTFMKEIKRGNTKRKALYKLDHSEKVKSWLNLGSKGEEPYNEFYENYINVRTNYIYREFGLKVFLNSLKSGKTKNESLKKSQLDDDELKLIYSKGKKHEDGYYNFYREYNEFLNNIFYEEKESKREKFISEYSKGLSFSDSLKISDLPEKYVTRCLDLKDETDYFKAFFNQYCEAEAEGYYLRMKDEKKEFFNQIKKGKTIEEACNISKLDQRKVNNWIHTGKNNNNEFTEFYDNYMQACIKFFNSKRIVNKQHIYLNAIGMGENNKDACKQSKLNINLINKWFSFAEDNIPPFLEFKQKYDQTIVDFFNSERFTEKQNIFLSNIKKGETQTNASKYAHLNPYVVSSWLNKGKKGIKPYSEFYEQYIQTLENQLNENKYEIEEFFKFISNGESNKKACELSGLNIKMINQWISKGRNGNELYLDFFNRYDEIKHPK